MYKKTSGGVCRDGVKKKSLILNNRSCHERNRLDEAFFEGHTVPIT